MRGRDVFMQSLVAHGVEHIFGNPGTTESPLLDALARWPQIDYVCHLYEAAAVGAASYYARISGRPALVNLHVAPGLGNGVGMIYNALKGHAPIVVTAGQQDSRILRREPILSHDLAAIAAPVTKWSTQVETADEMDEVMRRAFRIATEPPCGPVFVALPIDVMEQETANTALAPGLIYRDNAADPAGIAAAARLLLAASRPVIVVGDEPGRAGAGAVAELVRLAERLGAPVWAEAMRGHISFPASHPLACGSLPFDAAPTRRALAEADLVLLVGGDFFEELWFSPGRPFPDSARIIHLEASSRQLAWKHPADVGLVGAYAPSLRALEAAVAHGADSNWQARAQQRATAHAESKAETAEKYAARLQKAWARAPISMPRVMAELRSATPADALIVEESITASLDFAANFPLDAPDLYLGARGGGIGQGVAGAIGAAIGRPDKPVLCISGDGSAMYSIQALWTAAQRKLPIVFAILANREYRVLKHNLDTYRTSFDATGHTDYPQMDIGEPVLDFVAMAASMGVPGVCVTQAEELASAVTRAFEAGGPQLVEIVIEGKR